MIFTLQSTSLTFFTVIIILNEIFEFVRMKHGCPCHIRIGYKWQGMIPWHMAIRT